MGIDDIAAVLHAPDVATRDAAISGHLRAMEDQLQQTTAAVSSLRRLLEGTNPAEIPVSFELMPAHTALVVSTTVDGSDALSWRRDAAAELRALLRSSDLDGLRRSGPDAALYSTALLEEERGEMSVLLPVTGAAASAGTRGDSAAPGAESGPRLVTIPASEFATAVHRGAPDDLDRVFTALGTTVAQDALGVPGPIREEYPVSELDTPDSTRWHTTIRWPIFRTTEQSPGLVD